MRRYYALSRFLKERFGVRVYRVTLDGGFTCPNVDGTVAVGGCVFCDNRSFSPNRRLPRSSIREQVQRGVDILSARYRAGRFLAYFQAATNTYAPVAKLRRLYDELSAWPSAPAPIAFRMRSLICWRTMPGIAMSAWKSACKAFTSARWTG